MKQKITLLLMLVVLGFSNKAQVTLSEDFDTPFTLNASTGWTVQNNSAPTGTLNWFQGNANVFSAYNGTNNSDYFAANYNSTAGTGDISNWLISPTVSLVNGATIQFATRTVSATTVYPDRMEVRISATGATTIPLGPASVGSYTSMFSVNSLLSTSSASAIPNGSIVATYPQSWTVYTATVSGITGTVNGRFAFRYFVTNGGPGGANSSYIGLDAVRYTLPCSQPSLSIATSNTTSICAGTSVSLSASNPGTISAASYSWNNGITGTTNIVSPTVTTKYTVYGTSTTGCVGTSTLTVSVTPSPNLQIPSYTICAGTSLTLTATGGSLYSINGGTASTVNTISIPPTTTASAQYTVMATGATTDCPVTKISTITVGPQLSVLVTASSASICPGTSVALTALSAANNYSWTNGSTNASISVTPSVSTVYTVTSTNTICSGNNTIAITVYTSPVVSMVMTPSANICSNSSVTVNASGANSYNYILSPNYISNVNPIILISPITTVVANSQFTLVGISSDGCASSSIISFSVNPNPVFVVSPAIPVVCINQTITLIAGGGASTYSWSGPNNSSSSSSLIAYTAGTTPTSVAFTVIGTGSNGCSSTQNINVSVSSCTGLESINGQEVLVYPNPFSSELNLKGITGKIELYNIIGEKVMSQQVNSTESLNTSALPKGIYVLKILHSQSSNAQALRLIKN